ncbi:chemotaxis-specific methylesterase CheB [Halodesulfurarchaeum formicicum]|uniref:Protein-glutamate methylesterase/protein-glutamine glutaminase n=1 Tax=Halodesulfurarchaeum formicicum TaxID=1873524 RepID=A0A1D8S5C8_9EURY|nr:chemotaxis-specific protein-glutamate methyltransferase CheB [Halodesulfurarchaeum formicicum]AOW80545.1 chemotaxis-specific methylesterase CheB [Halodesulfurarchaeum formicicum]APE95884.1 two-component system, chemotaxis family, response regulator CheB [Halodesulfurarchaeum formicicum]
MTRVLVVDDSHFMRTVITDILEDAGLTVVAQAANGREAVELVADHDPDVVTMDVEMPEMNGIEAVEAIMDHDPVPIMMLSALTTDGADATLEAMEKGAVDFFAKPSGTISTDLSAHAEALVRTVESVAQSDPTAQTISTGQRSTADREGTYVDHPTLVIGASTGGPNVVESILADLPRSADFRVLVVQHMPDQFTGRFAKRLDGRSAYDVREASDGDRIGGGEALIAKGDYHMVVSGYSSGRLRVRLEQSAPVHSVRPAIDVTMESVAETIDDPVTAVVLTGMGSDGAAGVEAIDAIGGQVLAQDEETSAVFGIPGRAIETGCVDGVHPADELVDAVLDTIRDRT